MLLAIFGFTPQIFITTDLHTTVFTTPQITDLQDLQTKDRNSYF